MDRFRRRVPPLILAAALSAGCDVHSLVRSPGPIGVDPDVTFAAHQVHQGFVVDRLSGGGTGTIDSPGWFTLSRTPTYVLQREGVLLASLRLKAPATVDVEPSGGGAEHVEPSWEDGAVRLTLRPTEGGPLRTEIFQRTGTSAGWSVLTRGAQNALDIRGSYRAELRDAAGKGVGWIRVRIGPYQEAPRIYDALLPSGVNDALAGAVAVALSSEIDWIESHTMDVYRGNRGGPLEQSVPVGR